MRLRAQLIQAINTNLYLKTLPNESNKNKNIIWRMAYEKKEREREREILLDLGEKNKKITLSHCVLQSREIAY